MKMKSWKYDGVVYSNEQKLRQAIFKKERKAYPAFTAEEWLKHGVVYTEDDVRLTKEQLAEQARAKRDRLLKQSDYYVMPDYPSTADGLEVVKAYRQTLRDITKQTSFPFEVIYPEKPSVLE